MSTFRLDRLFSPRSVAVVGASPRASSPGHAVLRNLRMAGFDGAIYLINPRYAEIDGIRATKSVQELAAAPDLVIIAAPPAVVPETVATAGEKGAAAAIIITAGTSRPPVISWHAWWKNSGPGSIRSRPPV